jgi:hypothetical protein
MTQYPDGQNLYLLSDLNKFSQRASLIFRQAIGDYHLSDSIDASINNPCPIDSIEYLFYAKSWTDCVQWHLEDEIRSPEIDAVKGRELKRRIDSLNQDRTDKVELIDNCFLHQFKDVQISQNARVNSESPAWALDRLSILDLKIYHMKAEAARRDASGGHIEKCIGKLNILYEQYGDLCLSINELIQDISKGVKLMKVYRQMKMYNDPHLNPILYKSAK